MPKTKQGKKSIGRGGDSSSRFLESILINIPHMVFVKDATDLRFVLFNKAGEDLLGVKNADLLGKNDYDFFPREQADAFVQADRKVLAGKIMVLTAEEPIDSPSQGRRYLRTKKVPILDGEGSPRFLLGISEDITEIKTSQATIESQRSALELASRLSSLGEMAGGIAHEINNPLAIIRGLTDLLLIQSKKNGLTKEKVQEVCGRLNNTVQRISQIIKSMQGLARDGSKDPKVKCSVNQILEDALSLCREKFISSGILVKVQASAESIEVLARPTEISQVLLNLLHNAHDALVDAQEKWILVELGCANARVNVAVIDSGPGVPQEIRDKVLEPFFTTKALGKGTGLGLSISRAIVENHGGRLQVGEKEGKTCFSFDLEQVENQSRVA